MSDTTYEVFQHYGTAAERAAFTPDPAAGIKPIYIWFETDTGKVYVYHTAWSQLTGSGTGGGGTTNTLSYLVQGGIIAQVSGYIFDVSAATYYILGHQYSSLQSQITLDTADSDPRIDVIAVDNTGTVVVVKGTAATNPSEPNIDPATQLKLGFILVPSSAAPSATNTILYAENAGGPGEWNWTTSGSGLNLASTTNPRTGSKDIEATNLPANSYTQGEKPSGSFDPHSVDILCLYIRSKAAWGNAKNLVVSLRLNGVLVGVNITIARSGTYGFDSSITSGYQLVAIPITAFAIPAGSLINQVRITGTGTGTTQGFYLDDIFFQVNGATNPVSGGLSQAEADARYLQRSNNLSDVASIASTTAALNAMVGDSGAGGTKGLVPAPGAGDTAAEKFLKADGSWDVPSGTGTGDVTGPANAVDNNLTQFNGTGGKTIEDSGIASANVVQAAAALDDNKLVRGDGGVKGTQKTGITVDDSDNVTGMATNAIGGALVANTKETIVGQFNIKPSNHSAAGASEEIDFAVSNEHTVILDENITLTFANPVDGGRYVIILIQDANGTNTVTWPTNVKWPGGSAPTITATANKADLVTLYYYASGSVYFASINQNYAIS